MLNLGIKEKFRTGKAYISGTSIGPTLVRAIVGGAVIRFGGMFFGFLVGVQLARGLGPEGYGVYGLAMAIIAVLSVPAEFGFPQLATREIASAHVVGDFAKVRMLIRWFSKVILTLSAVIVSLTALYTVTSAGSLGSSFSNALVWATLMIPAVALLHLYSGALRGLNHLVFGQLFDALVRPAMHSLLLFFASWTAAAYLTPALAMGLGALSSVSAMLAAKCFLNQAIPKCEVYSTALNPEVLWREAFPMAMTEGMRMLQGHVAVFLLGVLASASAVGYFKVASAVMLLISTPIALFNLVSAPMITKLFHQSQHKKLQRLLSFVAIGMTLSSLVLMLPFVMFGERLISIIFGADYSEAAILSKILLLGVLLSAIFGSSAGLLNMTGHAVRVTRASGISLLVLILGCLIAIPACGAVGSAVVVAGSMILWSAVMWWDARRLLGLNSSVWGALF